MESSFRTSSFTLLNRVKEHSQFGLPFGILVSPFQSTQPNLYASSPATYASPSAPASASASASSYASSYASASPNAVGSEGLQGTEPTAVSARDPTSPSDQAGGSSFFNYGSDPSEWYLRRTCLRCSKCSAAINRYCNVSLETGKWHCVICGNTNSHKAELSDMNLQSYPELAHKIVEYIEPSAPGTPYSQGSYVSQQNPLYVLVLDELMAHKDLNALGSAVTNALGNLPRNAMISVISYSNVVSVYQVSPSEIIAAQVFSGTNSLTKKDGEMLKKNLIHFSSALEYCQGNVSSILEVFSKNKKEQKTKGKVNPAYQSCLGAAIQAATMLIEAHGNDAGFSQHHVKNNILVFLSRCPNHGPGAIQKSSQADSELDQQNEQAANFYKEQASKLYSLGVRADLFCIGNQSVGISRLKHLARNCGGYIFTYKTAGIELEADLYNCLFRPLGRGAQISFQTSAELALARVVGPIVPTNSSHLRKSAFIVPTIDPQQFYSAFFELVEDIPAEAVYIQLEIRYVNNNGELVTRVTTLSIPTTGSKETFLSTIDLEVTTILLSRLEVLDSREFGGDIQKINNHIDATLRKIIKSCGNLKAPPSFQLPETLMDLPFRLFHLRRGPLLGVLLQHADDIEILQNQFLYASPESSRKYIQPQLFEAVAMGPTDEGQQPQIGFREIPLENLVLRSNRVLLFDDGINIFVWSGNATTGPQYDLLRAACLSYASHFSQHRFPRPTLMSFKEGESMARFLNCRLSVLHKDQPHEQDVILPELKLLTADERKKLSSKFFRTDEFSFLEYCRWLSSERVYQ